MKHLLFATLLIWSVAAQAQTRKSVIGCWTMPGVKEEYLSLDPDSNFFFNDYREYTRSFESLFGTWKLKGALLILTYGERREIRFKVVWTEDGVRMLVKPGRLRLFKATPEDCK